MIGIDSAVLIILLYVQTASCYAWQARSYQHQSSEEIDGFNRDICGQTEYDDWPSTDAFCEKARSVNVSTRIGGGNFASLGQFPSYVQLIFYTNHNEDETWRCGGSLISRDLVVTAAHCVTSDESRGKKAISGVKVEAGRVDDEDEDEEDELQTRWGQVLCAHPGYTEARNDYDLALIKTFGPFEYNNRVQPACLELEKQHRKDTECYTVGHGLYDSSKTLSPELKYLKVKRNCADGPDGDLWAEAEQDKLGTACYRAVDRGMACQGDSGGAVYCMDSCNGGSVRQYVVALVNFGLRANVGGELECQDGDNLSVDFNGDLFRMRDKFPSLVQCAYDPV